MTTTFRGDRVANQVIDQFHSELMDDDMFQEAMMRVAENVARQSGVTDEEDLMELAMELVIRVSVS